MGAHGKSERASFRYGLLGEEFMRENERDWAGVGWC